MGRRRRGRADPLRTILCEEMLEVGKTMTASPSSGSWKYWSAATFSRISTSWAHPLTRFAGVVTSAQSGGGWSSLKGKCRFIAGYTNASSAVMFMSRNGSVVSTSYGELRQGHG